MLLVERVYFHSVREWSDESALIWAVKSSGSEPTGVGREAVRLFSPMERTVNETGAEWKTALMHSATCGNWDLCATLFAHGVDPAGLNIVGRTAAGWAHCEG